MGPLGPGAGACGYSHMGGLKDSGYGYEGGHEGLDAYLVHRHIAQALA
jgi:acyl-CoA reductase-like NAD-dependent aldehyde dehydrogenase